MIQSENVNELLAALVEAQAEMPTMPKDTQGYGYKYANLDTIAQAIRPILHKHGLAYMQSVGGLSTDGMVLTTRVFNGKGQYIEDTAALPSIASAKNNAAQTLGMSITYMRRYALSAMLGITSDEDTDANADGAPQGNARPAGQNPPARKAPAAGPEPKKPAAKSELKGGESTPEEKARIRELCKAKYADGRPVFSREEMELYSSYRKDKTAAELIAFIENALRNRRPDAPELRAATQPRQPPAAQARPNAAQPAEEAAADGGAQTDVPPCDGGHGEIF